MQTDCATKSKRLAVSLACAVICGAMVGERALASTLIWDAGVGGGDLNWTTNNLGNTNWSPEQVPTSVDDVVFNQAGVATDGTTTTNIVDTNFAINTLSYTNTGSGSFHNTLINNGQTLTVGTSSSVGTVLNVGVTSGVTGSPTNAVIAGAGSLAVYGSATAVFGVGVYTGLSTPNAAPNLNMSGLANFSASIGNVNIGLGNRQNVATLTLAATNTITAGALRVGNGSTGNSPAGVLNLGQTNSLNVDTLNVAVGRNGVGTLQFRPVALGALTAPTVTIRGQAGGDSAATTLAIGDAFGATGSQAPNGTVNFDGGDIAGTVDAKITTIIVARGGTTSNVGGTGSLTMGAGTIAATTINVGVGNNSVGTNNVTGTVNMTANAGTLTATTVNLASQANAGANQSAIATWNQNGGVAAINSLTLGDRGATAGSNVTATYNLAGGTLKAQTIQPGSDGSGGTLARNFNWNGGTLRNLDASTDLTIAAGLTLGESAVGNRTFTADANRTITVNATVSGANPITVNGGGTVALNAANTYTGTTTVAGGRLVISPAARPNALSPSTGGLDITGGKIVFDYTGGLTPVASIKGLLDPQYATHFASGQIRSTTLASNRTIGYGDDGVSAVTVLITLPGDADLNGTVNFNDFLVLQNNFGQANTRFDQGNFNYDGVTDFNDFLTLQNNFGQSIGGGAVVLTADQVAAITAFAATVPEPATLSMLGLGAMAMVRRRRV